MGQQHRLQPEHWSVSTASRHRHGGQWLGHGLGNHRRNGGVQRHGFPWQAVDPAGNPHSHIRGAYRHGGDLGGHADERMAT